MNKHTLFVLSIASLFAILLIAIGLLRYDDAYKNQMALAAKSVQNLAYDTKAFIQERERLVRLFGNDNIALIRTLAENPDDSDTEQLLHQKAARFFPKYFSLTIADKNGNLYIEDFDGLMGELCITDIQKFTKTKKNSPRIHPHTDVYHFDIMALLNDNNKEFILFISFQADILSNAIRSAQVPGHQLLLTYPTTGNNLIEVTAGGARNVLTRDNFILQDDEVSRTMQSSKIEGTDWLAEDLHSPDLFNVIRNTIIMQFSLIYMILIAICILMIINVRKEESRRIKAEQHKNNFVSSVSHELRTPITAVNGTLSLVLSGVTGDIGSKSKEMLAIAQRNCNRLTYLINDLLDLQKIEAGKMKYNIKEHDIIEITENAIENCLQYAKEFNVSYNLNINTSGLDSKKITANVDDSRITQVIVNILSNAAKYGAENDTIDVKIETDPDNVSINIIDHGDGIPAEIEKLLFEKFTRAKVHSENNIKGTGLGLNISKNIIEKHSGTISVKSVPGHTCFSIRLPIVK